MTKVVNIFGGPGSGKSTVAADLFSVLKRERVNVELVTEYAKDLTWEGRTVALANQPYILGKQFHRMFRVADHVDLIITDSPILLSAVYAMGEWDSLEQMAMDLHCRFENLNVMLVRDPDHYFTVGRRQTYKEALGIDLLIEKFLKAWEAAYHPIAAGPRTAPWIRDLMKERWSDLHRDVERRHHEPAGP